MSVSPDFQLFGFVTVKLLNFPPLLSYLPRAVQEATKNGFIRPSIVHPLTRFNPGDSSGKGIPNIELRQDPSLDYVEIVMSAKGCGAELGNVAKIYTGYIR